MRFALLIPTALLCAFSPQDRNYEEYELTKFRVRGGGNRWEIDMTLRHQFPKGAVISIEPKQRIHRFSWRSKGFLFGIDEFDDSSSPVNCESGNRILRTRNLTVPAPGMYEFCFWFTPNVQTRSRHLRRQMGDRNYLRYDLPQLSRTIGKPDKMLEALRRDTDKCAKMIVKAKKLMDRIERESEDRDWLDKAEEIFTELRKMKSVAEEQRGDSLHNAAFQMIAELLEEVIIVGNVIKRLKAEASDPSGGGPSSDDDGPDTTHPEDGGNKTKNWGIDGKRLSIEKTRKHLELADVARLREYFSWITLIHQEGIVNLWGAYEAAKKDPRKQGEFRTEHNRLQSTNKELGNAFKHLFSKKDWKAAIEPWTLYLIDEEETRYAGFFDRVNRFMKLLSEDFQAPGAIPQGISEKYTEISKELSTARAKVMGKF